jgi:hypothetical protein
MTPIPIPTDVATCAACGGSIEIADIWEVSDFSMIEIELDCVCKCGLEEGYLQGVGSIDTLITWIARKLTQPDAEGAT